MCPLSKRVILDNMKLEYWVLHVLFFFVIRHQELWLNASMPSMFLYMLEKGKIPIANIKTFDPLYENATLYVIIQLYNIIV